MLIMVTTLKTVYALKTVVKVIERTSKVTARDATYHIAVFVHHQQQHAMHVLNRMCCIITYAINLNARV